ncbi:MAG TPA: GNAT family N-acetyltransferase [Actinomycetota bacterium]|nr:GNAT family N-acetyltransferase [Actinomycetota bacterium]
MEIRPAVEGDTGFLREMLYEAATWNPDWPREPIEEVLAEPLLARYVEGWGRAGDAGVVAEIDGESVGAAWFRVFTLEEPGYGFVDDKVPELAIAVVPLHRRKGIGTKLLDALVERARDDGYVSLSLSVAAHNRSRMMYERAGFSKVRAERSPAGEHWTMRLDL